MTQRKTNLTAIFPHLFKTIKKRLEIFESGKGKVVSSNFQEKFNREKVRKNTNKYKAFCFSFLGFFTKITQSWISKVNTSSVLNKGNRT